MSMNSDHGNFQLRSFYWLSTRSRPTLQVALEFDLVSTRIPPQELNLLAMRVVETIRRLNQEVNSKRIDIRPISRAKEMGLMEVRWNYQVNSRNLIVRLFLVEDKEGQIRVGIRLFNKHVQPDLQGTNRLQDLAIDDAIRIFTENRDAKRLEIV